MIHGDNPFVDDPDSRDPVRRFRGRLSAPVTIITSGDERDRAGLTVSSLIVVEGSPGEVRAVVGPSTDLWDMIAHTGRFVIHICSSRHRALAEVFAGLRPSPGGVFAGLAVTPTEWGPVLDDLGDRAYCSYRMREEVGYSGLVTGSVERVEAAELTEPLAYFRGSYRTLN